MPLALCLVFFLSGASALLFETLWFRQAGLMLGNSVWTSSLVLASFMGGLAIGNGLAARHGGRLRQPLFVYALLETAIGLTGVGLVFLFPALTPFLAPALRALTARPWILNALRAFVAFALMLIPAAAMGLTLPLLVRTLSARDASFGRVLGRLYGWNTLGAVAGALAGEALLIERLGVRGTGVAAALLNGAAALAAAALSRGAAGPVPDGDAPRPPFGPAAWRIVAAAFVSGGLLLALEVVWFRFLLLFVYGTSLTFAVMLSVILLGIAGGGLLASWWLEWRVEAQRALPFLAFGSGMLVALTYLLFQRFIWPHASDTIVRAWTIFSVSLPLMFPVCLLSGVLFTFMGKCLKQELGEEARAAGVLTLANTLGAMAGALAGGFVLLPRLGMEASLAVLGWGYGIVAWLTLGSAPAAAPLRRGALYAASAAGLLFFGVLWLFPSGLMRYYLRLAIGRFLADGSQIVAVREGLTETVVFLRTDLWGEPLFHRLMTNGFSMSSTSFGARRYMKLFVYWPVALHPRARHALLISYGVGSTAKALTDTSTLESIDIVDISRDVVELSRVAFRAPETAPLDDPRVRVHIEDGRFFLLTTDRRYDLITAEPPPPKSAGIVNLYSREYFRLVHERLAQGGIATYWLPVFQLEPREAKTIVRAFCDAFEDCSLWTGYGPEWMLAGTRGARGPVSAEQFGRQWRDPVVGPTLRSLGFETPEQLGALFIADAPFLRDLTRDVAPLEDDHPYRLSRRSTNRHDPFYLSLADANAARERFAASGFIRALWPEEERAKTLAFFDLQAILNSFFWASYGARMGAGLPELEEILSRSTLREPALWLMGSSVDEQRIAKAALERGVKDPMLDEILGVGAMADRDYLRAERHFRQAQPHAADAERLVEWRVLALCLAGKREPAVDLTRRPGTSLSNREAWSWLARRCGLPDLLAAR